MNRPFRWNIAKREQLGRLPNEAREVPQAAMEEIRRCTARIIAFCDNAELIFVGRSLETIFDYLSGLLRGTTWEDRLSLLNVSLQFSSREWMRDNRQAVMALRDQLRWLALEPSQIAKRPRPLAFIDVVDSGHTFGVLTELLLGWAKEEKADVSTVKRKLRFVGLTQKMKTSPNTWRWQQQNAWAGDFPPSAIKNVSVNFLKFWSAYEHWGDRVSSHNPPWRWGDSAIQKPPRDDSNVRALQLAVTLYELGCGREEKQAFTKQLVREHGMKHSWYRNLISEIRKTGLPTKM